MWGLKDSAIKLFGKTIPLPTVNNGNHKKQKKPQEEDVCCVANEQSCSGRLATLIAEDFNSDKSSSSSASSLGDHDKSAKEESEQEENKESSGKVITKDQEEDGTLVQITEDSKDPTSSSNSENPKTPSVERETSSLKSSKNGGQSDISNSQEKTLKKPDKILPCPRCNSMDTKFCYYNNYNVNQPRHFCKNCQRYWTAGGTMRNVPVGAGRRKNKSSSASSYRQMMVTEALRAAQAHAMSTLHGSGNNGTVLTFGSDSSLCESVTSVLNLTEKNQSVVRNGYHRPERRILVDGDDRSSGSTVTALNSSERGCNSGSLEVVTKNYRGFSPQLQCFQGPTWPYPWNSSMHPPTVCPSGFPVSFYPAPPYWGCTVPSPWNVNVPASSLNHSTSSSSPTSPLGKHSRDGNIIRPENYETNSSERSVLVPKTLRIDDPSEAAKSSIWATLGIKNDKSNSINGGGLFKGFQSKSGDRNCVSEASPVLQANPAAMSRSLNFHEST